MSTSAARRGIGLVAAITGLLVSAGTLGAGPASAAPAPTPVWVEGDHLLFRSGAAVANTVTLEAYGEGGFSIRDTGAPMALDPARAGGCVRLDDNRIGCPATSTTSASFDLGDGNDRFTSWVHLEELVWGGNGADTISSGPADDELRGGAGDDDLYAGAGDDRVYGGDHYDDLFGDAGHDYLDGEGSNDVLRGGDGNDLLANPNRTRDTLAGDGGNDVLETANRLTGGAGDDYIWVNAGFGDYYGDAGYDTIDYTYWPYPTLGMNLDGDDNDGSFLAECHPLVNCPTPQGRHNVHGDFERVIGSGGNDRIEGNGNANLIEGRGGDDWLLGHDGSDNLDAGPGNGQATVGGEGRDTCRGQNVTNSRGCDIFPTG